MTIYEANNLLIAYFKSNHAFNLERDFVKLGAGIISDEPEDAKAAVQGALEHLANEAKLLSKVGELYILNRPYIITNQFIGLDFNAVLQFVELISRYTKLTGKEIAVDPFNISVDNLTLVCTLASNAIDNFEKERQAYES